MECAIVAQAKRDDEMKTESLWENSTELMSWNVQAQKQNGCLGKSLQIKHYPHDVYIHFLSYQIPSSQKSLNTASST